MAENSAGMKIRKRPKRSAFTTGGRADRRERPGVREVLALEADRDAGDAGPAHAPNTSIGSPHGVLGRSTSSVIAVGSRAVMNVRVLLVVVPAALVAVSR